MNDFKVDAVKKIEEFSYEIGTVKTFFPTLVLDLRSHDQAIKKFTVGDLIELENGESVRVVCAQGGCLKIQPSDPFAEDTSVLEKALPKILQIVKSKKK